MDREGGRGGAGATGLGCFDFEEQQPPAPELEDGEGPSAFLDGFFLSVQQAHPPPAEEKKGTRREK